MSAPAEVATTPPTTQIGGITVYDNYVHHLQSIPHDSHPAPFPLKQYVSDRVKAGERKDQFVYEKDCQFQLQLRSGPLVHSEYHIQAGEEWYYVLEGTAYLKILTGFTVELLTLAAGTCFLVPGGQPKSLQLASGCTVLVMNRQRKTKDSYPHYNKTHQVEQLKHLNGNAQEQDDPLDFLLWLCPTCSGVAHKERFLCTDYFTQTASLIQQFDSQTSEGKIRCKTCNATFPDTQTKVPDDNVMIHTPESVGAIVTQSVLAQNVINPACPSPAMNPATHPPPYQLFEWIEAHKHLLAPPVCNSMIHSRGTQWKVMIVGGPNQRTDYHIDDGEEWFLMIKGNMVLKVVDDAGTRWRDIPIKEGESFLLPANVPHSPQRYADTIGLVIERDRFTYELDGLRWWCSQESCRSVLRTFSFRCEDLGSQLKTLIEYWYEDSPEGKKRRTCGKCGHEEKKPATLAEVKQWTH